MTLATSARFLHSRQIAKLPNCVTNVRRPARPIGAAVVVLTELRRCGVRVALDDFGTGYSSLSYLHRLPIHIIKIDRSFVIDLRSEADLMLQAIVTLGQSLGLEIVAEGIEKSSDLERLRRFEHMAGQGYLFARPMTAIDAIEFGRHNTSAAKEHQRSIVVEAT